MMLRLFVSNFVWVEEHRTIWRPTPTSEVGAFTGSLKALTGIVKDVPPGKIFVQLHYKHEYKKLDGEIISVETPVVFENDGLRNPQSHSKPTAEAQEE
jgi:hypothetical protein